MEFLPYGRLLKIIRAPMYSKKGQNSTVTKVKSGLENYVELASSNFLLSAYKKIHSEYSNFLRKDKMNTSTVPISQVNRFLDPERQTKGSYTFAF